MKQFISIRLLTTRIWTRLRYLAVIPLLALGVLSILATGGGGGGGGGGAPPSPSGFVPDAVFIADKETNGVDELFVTNPGTDIRKLSAPLILGGNVDAFQLSPDGTRVAYLADQEINEVFRAQNGVGLPVDYELEDEPGQWDWYDLAVVSYYWANTPYDGVLRSRTAHRGRIYAGTMTEIATKIFQAGGDSGTLLFQKDKIEAVYDAFEWEAFFRRNGLYNPRMWEERYTGEDIWSAMAKGEVFLAFMHQLDAFFVHGTDVMRGYLDDSGDMATAIMPKGVSLELDANGRPVREGTHASNLSGWWWGIPTTSPDPKLSYELARYITSPEFHAAEVSAFGMMPILKELTENLNRYIPEQWMLDVFKTAD